MYNITLPALNPNPIDLLISELKKASGMDFEHYQRNFLEKRIDYRMKHLNLDRYQQYINYINSNPNEIDLFLDKFTINYTYFFRNFNVFESFEKFLKIYIRNLKRPLKIWSAPCATGDEPYTIAMMLDQYKNSVKEFPDFKIIASDIDTNALIVAKKGIYGEYAVHETPKNLLNTYFSRQDTNIGPKYKINNNIKNKVTFFQEDIIKGHQNNEKFDIIFCRNFIIYINQYAREKLMRVIESRLYNGGLLVLGGSETFSPQGTCFETINIRDRFYIKNLSSQDESFQRKIYNSFQSKEARNERKYVPNKKRMVPNEKTTEPFLIEKKLKKIDGKKQIKKKSIVKKTSVKARAQNTPKSQSNPIIKKPEPAELKITDIVVNNGNNNFAPKSKKKPRIHPKIEEKSPLERKEILLGKKEEDLRLREVSLERRLEDLEQRSNYLEKEKEKLEIQRKKIEKFYANSRKKERQIDNKIQILEQLKKRLEKREQVIEQKERQLQDRLNHIGQYSRQVIQREIQVNINSKEIELREEMEEIIPPFDEKRYDRVEKTNSKNEYVIPMGYYGLINSFDNTIHGSKFSIEGLGSSIGLILKDPINNIFAMSHISLPDSSASKQGYHLLFPHTFADTSVKDLYDNLIYNGANESNIRALIIGGAKLFLDYDMTYQENLDVVKKELQLLEIEIDAEDTGGLSERSIVYDTINDTLFVRKSWEFQYRKILQESMT